MNQVIALIIALTWAAHVSLPGLPAPAPILLAFALVLGGLTYLIARTMQRDGLYPVRRRAVPS